MNTDNIAIDPFEGSSRQSDQQLSRRTDLADAIGIVITLPDHARGQDGQLRWGADPFAGAYDQRAYQDFQKAMLLIPEETVKAHERIPSLQRTEEIHLYETGPAAQTWPQFALMLWEHAEPILSSGVLVVEAGKIVRDVIRRAKEWHDDTNTELAHQYEYNPTQPYHRPERVEFRYALTQGAAIALAAEDVQTRHAVSPPFTIQSFVRGFPGYSDANHPSWSTSYLVQCHVEHRSFMYHYRPGGELSEHYLVFGSDVTPLAFPPTEDGRLDMFHTVFAGLQISVR
ncbi:MAG: hypothetical protein QM589_17080 [Thermomicrobiales bacterium]